MRKKMSLYCSIVCSLIYKMRASHTLVCIPTELFAASKTPFFHISALQCYAELHIGARVCFFGVKNYINGRDNCASIQRASKDDFATALAIFSTEAPLSISLPESLPMNHLSTPLKETPSKKKRSRPIKNNNTYICRYYNNVL